MSDILIVLQIVRNGTGTYDDDELMNEGSYNLIVNIITKKLSQVFD
jgi:hypothetical protein